MVLNGYCPIPESIVHFYSYMLKRCGYAWEINGIFIDWAPVVSSSLFKSPLPQCIVDHQSTRMLSHTKPQPPRIILNLQSKSQRLCTKSKHVQDVCDACLPAV
jgi:hypothetical protein